MRGALLNTAAVLVGGTAGLLLGQRLPVRAQTWALRGLGVVTLVLGAQMLLETRRPLVLALALVLGMVTGTLLRIQRGLEAGAQWLQDRLVRGEGSSRLAEGFVTTSLLFCVGPMTILGSIKDGLTGDYKLIAVKAAMDGVSSLAFAAGLGWGVLLSAVTVLVVQGGITLGAQSLAEVLTPPLIAEGTAAGGVLVLCIGSGLVGLKKLPVADYLPAIFYAPLLAWWLQ